MNDSKRMINGRKLKSLQGPEIPFAYDQILKDGGRIWDDVNGGYLPEDLALAARREEIALVRSEGAYEIVPMQECNVACKKLLHLIWMETDKSVDPAQEKKRSRLCAREYQTNRQEKFQTILFSATS